MFTDKEFELITRLFFQLVPSAVRSIQSYDPMHIHRNGYVIGFPALKKGAYKCLYLDIENITPWQLKTFDRRAKKELPGLAYIEQYGDITRVGFRK